MWHNPLILIKQITTTWELECLNLDQQILRVDFEGLWMCSWHFRTFFLKSFWIFGFIFNNVLMFEFEVEESLNFQIWIWTLKRKKIKKKKKKQDSKALKALVIFQWPI